MPSYPYTSYPYTSYPYTSYPYTLVSIYQGALVFLLARERPLISLDTRGHFLHVDVCAATAKMAIVGRETAWKDGEIFVPVGTFVALVPSYPRTFLPSYLLTLVFLPSYLLTLVPSYPHTLIPSYLRHSGGVSEVIAAGLVMS